MPIDYSRKPSFWAESDAPLGDTELARVRRALEPGEQVVVFARGRTDSKRALWVATDRRLLRIGLGWRGTARAEAYIAVTALEIEEGAHGWTLRLTTGASRHPLIAVAPPLGKPLMDHLEARTGRSATFIASRRAAQPARPDTQAPVVSAPTLVAPTDNTRMMAQLKDAADLLRQGLLSEEEFTLLKQRLLGTSAP